MSHEVASLRSEMAFDVRACAPAKLGLANVHEFGPSPSVAAAVQKVNNFRTPPCTRANPLFDKAILKL